MYFVFGTLSIRGYALGIDLMITGDVLVEHGVRSSDVNSFGNCFHLLFASAVVTQLLRRRCLDLALALLLAMVDERIVLVVYF